jgi:hypothetical protein
MTPKQQQLLESKVRKIVKKVMTEAEMGNYKSDPREIIDMIYDTLLHNKQYPQLDIDLIDDQEVNKNSGSISFTYDNIPVTIKIKIG